MLSCTTTADEDFFDLHEDQKLSSGPQPCPIALLRRCRALKNILELPVASVWYCRRFRSTIVGCRGALCVGSRQPTKDFLDLHEDQKLSSGPQPCHTVPLGCCKSYEEHSGPIRCVGVTLSWISISTVGCSGALCVGSIRRITHHYSRRSSSKFTIVSHRRNG